MAVEPEKAIKSTSIYLLIALIGLMLADLGILYFRDKFLPAQPPPAKQTVARQSVRPTRQAYTVVETYNMFNADGKIPPAIGAPQGNPDTPADAPPVPSTLPLQLVGTIVHANPKRSIATVLLRNKNEQIPIKVDDEIPDNLAVMTLIERNKVTFRNSQTGRLEYIEMAEEGKLSFNSAGPAQPKQVGEVMQKSETEFELKRDDVNKMTSNLPQLLQQARAVPRMGPGGQIECFSLADIAPDSIYERLGLRRGDCIKSVNGERIDSPGKAMDMYNALRSGSSQIQIGIERGGRDENMSYSISN